MRRIFLSLTILALMLPLTALAATVTLQPISGSESNNRWMDIADNLYSSDYQSSFNYVNPTVMLSYESIAGTFSGTLTATGLKPNFAYQMKLEGDGSTDNWSNEQLGYAGRWWEVQPDPGNRDDTYYNDNKDNLGYIFQGYLLFDFFATDEQGNASVSFSADSSYHVLYATMDSTGVGTGHLNPGSDDSAVIYYDFNPSPDTNSDAYNTEYEDAHVGIFAQREPGRALPGELTLPMGDYSASFVLTEESFHQASVEGGGNWASVLEGDVNFSVVPIPGTAFLLGSALIGLIGVRRKLKGGYTNHRPARLA